MAVTKAELRKVEQVAGQVPVAPAKDKAVAANPDKVVRGPVPKAPDAGMPRRVGGLWASADAGKKKDDVPAHVKAAYEFIVAHWAKGGDAQASVGEQLATKIVMTLDV